MIGYVENNEYCQKIIAQRIKDGILDEAPIFGDIRAFNGEGYAASYTGLVDVISGGFPCQDISCAGKGAGITGERSGMWFEMESAIRTVRPLYVFIENSPMLLVRGFERVICGLSEMGFDAAWGIVSAADVGAPHLRERVWILAHNPLNGRREGRKGRLDPSNQREPKQPFQDLADTSRIQPGRPQQRSERKRIGLGRESINVPDATNTEQVGWRHRAGWWCRSAVDDGRKNAQGAYWWQSEPAVGRVAHGVAHRVDRLRAIGNGQVPIVAATAFRILSGILGP
jgi:DNA (cytosine-5)-methyltransferase 1